MPENAIIVSEHPKNTMPITHQRTPMDLIELALSNNGSIEQLERLWALQEKYEASEAKKAFHEAMAGFKSNPPDINKDSQVSYEAKGRMTAYKHASLGNVTEKINKALSQHGLSAAWKTEQLENGLIKVTCTITHKQGYSESTSLASRPDDSGGKNPIQSIGSTITYLERYTILALTGLATKEQDDDGKSANQTQQPDLSKSSQEYKEMLKAKEIFPEFYTLAVEHFKSEPINRAQYKQVTAFINEKVSQQDNQK